MALHLPAVYVRPTRISVGANFINSSPVEQLHEINIFMSFVKDNLKEIALAFGDREDKKIMPVVQRIRATED